MKKNNIDIEQLLRAFYEGSTTVAEEQAIERYFESHGEDVMPHLLADKKLFQALHRETMLQDACPEGLEDRLGSFVDSLDEHEKGETPVRWILWARIALVAASVLLAAGALAVFVFNNDMAIEEEVNKPTIANVHDTIKNESQASVSLAQTAETETNVSNELVPVTNAQTHRMVARKRSSGKPSNQREMTEEEAYEALQNTFSRMSTQVNQTSQEVKALEQNLTAAGNVINQHLNSNN